MNIAFMIHIYTQYEESPRRNISNTLEWTEKIIA